MNHKKFAEMWYNNDNIDLQENFAKAIKRDFVSREKTDELKGRFASAIITIGELQHDAFRAGFAEDAERLRGKSEGIKLALAWLVETEDAE